VWEVAKDAASLTLDGDYMEHEDIIGVAVKHIPQELREDARQAGYIGLMNGLKNRALIQTNIRGYLYRCISNEMIREIAKLYRPFALSSNTFNQLLKYKKFKRFGKLDSLSKMNVEELERLLRIKQLSYDDHQS